MIALALGWKLALALGAVWAVGIVLCLVTMRYVSRKGPGPSDV